MSLRIPQQVPNVCIFEAEESEVNFHERDLYNKTVNWIQEGWVDQLNNYTNSNNWDMTYEYIPNATHYDKKLEDFPQCHVLMVWDAKNEETRAQGYTAFDHSKSTHQFSFIDVFTWAPINEINLGLLVLSNYTQNEAGEYEIPLEKLTFEYEPISDEAIRIVVQHEFGHALGLGHYTKTMDNNYNSIMPPSIDFNADDEYLIPFQVSEDDIKAVIAIYGEDGLKSHLDPPMPKYGYGWVESVAKGTQLTGEFLIDFGVIILNPQVL
ncbi:MAG: matrixin family metalloprotease [Candidatus Heimdallarchaeota archaeon]